MVRPGRHAAEREIGRLVPWAQMHGRMVVEMDALIIDAVRTPVGKLRGALSLSRPDDLAAFAIEQLLRRNGGPVPEEVFFGCANQAGEDNPNVARIALLLAGLPQSVPGVTVNPPSATGLEAGRHAAPAIRPGAMEPCGAARAGGTSLEKLGKLTPAFREGGTVTAGNSSGLNDGASALLLASEGKASQLGLRPLARIVASASAGVDPRFMGIGPVPATQKALARAGLRAEQLDLVELNEAFASQSLAVIEELRLDPERVNVDGGAIALGHPLGMSGARILGHLAHSLKARGGRYGLATLCVGVGQGVSVIIEAA